MEEYESDELNEDSEEGERSDRPKDSIRSGRKSGKMRLAGQLYSYTLDIQ